MEHWSPSSIIDTITPHQLSLQNSCFAREKKKKIVDNRVKVKDSERSMLFSVPRCIFSAHLSGVSALLLS